MDTFVDKVMEYIEKYYWFFLAMGMGLVVFLCFYRLDVKYVISWDEARFGINAYEMLKSKNFIMNTFRYEPDYWNLKPPLSMWGTALSFLIFGYNKMGLRAFSAICYIVLCVIAGLFVKKNFGKLSSLFTVLFLCANTACFSFHMVRAGDSDSLYILFFTLSMFCMLLMKDRPNMLYGAGFFFACAFLTKSWHAGTIVIIGFLFLLLTGEFKKMNIKRWGGFLASFLIPMGVWAAARFTQDGIAFFKEMILYELLTSSSSAIENHDHEFLFYFKYFFTDNWKTFIYMAALFIAAAGVLYYGKCFKEKKNKDLLIGFVLWFVVPIGCFSIAATKLIWYSYASLIPVLIGAGIVAGYVLKERKIPSFVRVITFALVLLLLGYHVRLNVLSIQEEYNNGFHDFFAEADEAVPELRGTHMYLGESGDFGYGNWSQNTSFLAEIHGDHICEDGGIEGFSTAAEPSVLITSQNYYDQYKEILASFEIAYRNDDFIYLFNGIEK